MRLKNYNHFNSEALHLKPIVHVSISHNGLSSHKIANITINLFNFIKLDFLALIKGLIMNMFGGNEQVRGRKIWELAHNNNKKKKVVTRKFVAKVTTILN